MNADSSSSFPENRWKEEHLYQDGDLFFNDLLNSIHSARKTIKIESYIFDLDDLGVKIIRALQEAAQRGVLVKLLLDGAGCTHWTYEIASQYVIPNFEIRFFHPLVWQRKNYRLWKYLSLNRLIRGLSLLNHRNHRKSFLIDDIAYLGSMNVSARHLKSVSKNGAWRDTGVRIIGDDISLLHESFNDAWSFYNNYLFRTMNLLIRDRFSHALINLNQTLRQRQKTYRNLIQRMNLAQKRILITTPYFIPTSRIRRTLKMAIRRGVEVSVLFPSQSDVKVVKWAMEGLYSTLLRSGIRIFEYRPSMIHSKVLITDDRVLLGSTNMNSRSLFLDLEADIEITHDHNRHILLQQWESDLEQSTEILLSEWKKRAWPRKWIESFFYLFRMVL